jgi:hypothetical protein
MLYYGTLKGLILIKMKERMLDMKEIILDLREKKWQI